MAADYGVLAYGRWDDESKIVVVINNNATPRTVSVPVWKIGGSSEREISFTDESEMIVLIDMRNGLYNTGNENCGELTGYKFKDGCCEVNVGGFGGVVLRG